MQSFSRQLRPLIANRIELLFSVHQTEITIFFCLLCVVFIRNSVNGFDVRIFAIFFPLLMLINFFLLNNVVAAFCGFCVFFKLA